MLEGGLLMNWKRLFLVLAVLLFLGCFAWFIAPILVSQGDDSLIGPGTNSKIPGASSDVFAKRYSTSHPPCSPTKPSGPTP